MAAVAEVAKLVTGVGVRATDEQFRRYGDLAAVPDDDARREVIATGLRQVDDLLAQMSAIVDDLRRADDRRWTFLLVYRDTTQAIRDNLARGRFLDVPWTTHLTLRFAGLYLEAHHGRDDGAAIPAVWDRAFDRAEDRGVSSLELVLQGMNAHINDDLPRAIAGMLLDFDLRPQDVVALDERDLTSLFARRHFDHEVVNDILAERVDSSQQRLNDDSRLLTVVDRLGGVFDELAFESVIRHFRGRVWHQALALAFAGSAEQRAVVRREVQVLAMANADRITALVDPVLGRLTRGALAVRRAVGRG